MIQKDIGTGDGSHGSIHKSVYQIPRWQCSVVVWVGMPCYNTKSIACTLHRGCHTHYQLKISFVDPEKAYLILPS
jgi:hypothetical protein